MKIVTYNVNGLRPRISQFGSLSKLLNSLDADIICFQETKIARQELRADLVSADGYESFFSCTRTTEKGRTGYSGVATFCRVKSAISSNEVALPLMAEEGFTGLLENSRGFGSKKEEFPTKAEGLEGCDRDELLEIDSEGRCVITDHGHFVLFNIYGPRAGSDERIQFKRTFFKLLQKRWECLLHKGRRVIVVGDLNIAPAAIDRCDADPDFEKNEFRGWFRSLLAGNGGPFFDVFRTMHPDRTGAYTCWSTSTGAEVFNFGTRIDHILSTRSCLHDDHNFEGHNFVYCHVEECDILTQFKRWKSGNTPRWKGERSIKLEGSDHAPVCLSLKGINKIAGHSTPSLSTRYCPQVYGCQQTLASVLMRRESAEQIKMCRGSASSDENNIIPRCDQSAKRPCVESKRKGQNQLSQLSLRLFFQKTVKSSEQISCSSDDILLNQVDAPDCDHYSNGSLDISNMEDKMEFNIGTSTQDQDELNSSPFTKEKRNNALFEWQRIQRFMQESIPLCKGHHEPCVTRVVKKAGPNLGLRFYVCARAEGPASNPEANCGYFKWATSKSKNKR